MNININFKEEDLYNLETERILLGIMMIDTNYCNQILYQTSYIDFYLKQHQLIYKAITELSDDNKDVDIVSVSELLKFHQQLSSVGGREYITELAMSIIVTSNFSHYLNILHKYSKKRKVIGICQDIFLDLNNSVDIDDIALKSKSSFSDVIINKGATNLTTIFTGVENVMTKVDRILTSDEAVFGLSTGFKQLDLITSGLCPGKFYIIGGRPAMGKSALAQQIAEHVATKHNVLYVTLEMGVDEFTERSILSNSGLTKEMLARKMITSEEACSKIAKSSERLANLNLFMYDKPRCSTDNIEQRLQELKTNNGGCDLIVIDYVQLMKCNDRRLFDSKDVVTQISNDLKGLAREYSVPVLALCQLSRQLEGRTDKRPLMSDLRESGALEQDADVVMFVYRQEYYTHSPVDRGKAELIVAKNRDGRSGTINLCFNSSKVKFMEVE